MIPSCRLCLVIFAVTLMLLVLWSQIMSDMGSLSGTTYQSIVPRRRPLKGPNAPPVLAYWILGSGGEKKRMLRLLKAIYHPRNQYLLHLDSSAGDSERVELALLTQTEKVLREFGNVNVVGKSYGVNQMGASGLAAVLHAAALLLRISADWDWFIPLTTSDYPLFTQDDILYALSPLPRDLNFVGYTNETTWNKRQNVARIVVDPNLYLKEKTPVFYAAETREKPDAFQIFGGSPWMILSRGLSEHCVNGWDNLPRKLLMYLNNVEFPLESYFQTLLCNTPEFQNTTVNDDLRYIITENTTIGRREEDDDDDVGASIMARPFREDDPWMQEIDKQLLKREAEPGKWCIERGVVNETAGGIIMSNGNNNTSSKEEEFCSVVWGDVDSVEAGSRGVKLEKILTRIIQEKKSVTRNKDICLH
ncbi:Beta-glucuronosyltransferase GlcAT14A [Sesamum alatum]|uniref:Beta-glucuronosyltransferase GlcAT14A n=1 Tax=Sesamum alatum TaxID=300844 RepID=A0AAE1YCF5_9LAMI|nr:Beta-glucuronosyltransferase GlcAT14A [Sesamum alatum]